ncbi:MAG: hypothetical protein P9L92_13560 [Candidatus Electryonea clarkiae]|nr:hypothetical protein [Candidatus Electryonea clarkiae]MDP8285655.1 hypothetical protein [Candidatus Electryonea clarkiae]
MYPAQNELLEELLVSTNDAWQAARIEHDTALDIALESRDKTIAMLFGFDPGQPLPAFSGFLSEKHTFNPKGKNLKKLRVVRRLQQNLEQALEKRSNRLQVEQGQVRKGSRYFHSIRENLRLVSGKQLDQLG